MITSFGARLRLHNYYKSVGVQFIIMNRGIRSFRNVIRSLFIVNLNLSNSSGIRVGRYVKSRASFPSDQQPKYLSNHVLAAISFMKILESLGLGNEKHPEIKELLSRAKELLQNGDVQEASKLYSEALTMAVNAQDSADIYYIKKKQAIIAFNSKQYSEAEQLFLEVRDYHTNKGVPGNDISILYADLRLAEIYDNLQNYEKAEQYYKVCARNIKPLMTKPADAELTEFWLLFLTSRAHYYLHRGIFDRASKYFAKAYDTCLRTKGEMNEQTVVLLQQLGSVYYQKGDLENAIKHLRKATDLGKHLPGLVELSNAYVSLGNILLKQGLIEEAKQFCDQGLKNAIRHKYEQGIRESNVCLKEAIQATS